MPALTIPSTSSLNSSHAGSNATELVDTRTNGYGNRNGIIPNINANATISAVEVKVPIRHQSPGSLRVDTRQTAMVQLQGSRRLIQPNMSSESPGPKTEQMKSSTMSPIAASDSIENIQRKLKYNLSRHAQNG